MKKILIFLLMNFFVAGYLFAQGGANIWHFGYHAGIDFNSGNPVAIYGPINTQEGVATICDISGDFLFSTNGSVIYNSNFDTMASGLFGNYSSTQSAIIVPFPMNSDKYYIFTSSDTASSNGICYSVIDMSLNGGLGGVVSINTQILTPACEKLTVIRNSNGTDYWVIAHSYPSNEFYVFPITLSGVGVPIITGIGLPISGTHNTIGYLKSSPNGQKLAVARGWITNDPIELFDFNATTGIISNYISIPSIGKEYGLSFSPDNSKLYVGFWEWNGIHLQQYDLTLSNFQNFPFTVLEGNAMDRGALQLAPNGKIYCAKNLDSTLGVINNPNLAGSACDYNDSGFPLFSGTSSREGLPNFMDSYFQSCALLVSLSSNNDTIFSNISGGALPLNYEWSNGSTTQNLTGMSNGSYSVTVTDANGCSESSNIKFVFVQDISFQNNFIISPNPATSEIKITNLSPTENQISLFNLLGQQVKSRRVSNVQSTTIPVSDLPAGIYVVTIFDGEKIVCKKLVKE